VLQRRLRDPDRQRRDPQPPVVEPLQRVDEALRRVAEHLVVGDEHLLEGDPHRLGGALPHLVLLLPHHVPLGVGGDDEGADPLRPARSSGVSVRPSQTITSPKPPLVIHALVPFSTQPPSTRRACAVSDAASEPASASESAKPPSSSPRAIGFSQRSFCASVPCARIICVGSELCTLIATATEASPQAICSSATR
jgi:hypothetical protein